MTTFPAMNADTLAVAIAMNHYHDIIDDADNARIFVDECLSQRDVSDDASRDDKLAAIADVVSDDLADYAHNANHVEYAPIFFADDVPNYDDLERELFALFTSDDVLARVVTILRPHCVAWLA